MIIFALNAPPTIFKSDLIPDSENLSASMLAHLIKTPPPPPSSSSAPFTKRGPDTRGRAREKDEAVQDPNVGDVSGDNRAHQKMRLVNTNIDDRQQMRRARVLHNEPSTHWIDFGLWPRPYRIRVPQSAISARQKIDRPRPPVVTPFLSRTQTPKLRTALGRTNRRCVAIASLVGLGVEGKTEDKTTGFANGERAIFQIT